MAATSPCLPLEVSPAKPEYGSVIPFVPTRFHRRIITCVTRNALIYTPLSRSSSVLNRDRRRVASKFLTYKLVGSFVISCSYSLMIFCLIRSLVFSMWTVHEIDLLHVEAVFVRHECVYICVYIYIYYGRHVVFRLFLSVSYEIRLTEEISVTYAREIGIIINDDSWLLLVRDRFKNSN